MPDIDTPIDIASATDTSTNTVTLKYDPTTQTRSVTLSLQKNVSLNDINFGDIFHKISLPGKSANFLEVSGEKDFFYLKLIKEINLLYDQGHFMSLAIMIRKLLENIIIDILRKKYGVAPPGLDLYYYVPQKRFQPFNQLLISLEEKIGDFSPLSSSLDVAFIRRIEKCKIKGNKAAHTIDASIVKDWFDKNKEEINYTVNILVSLSNKIT